MVRRCMGLYRSPSKIPPTGLREQQTCVLSQSWGLRVQGQGSGRFSIWQALCSQREHGPRLTVSSCGRSSVRGRDAHPGGQGPTPVAPFNLHYFLRGRISTETGTPGLGLQPVHWGENEPSVYAASLLTRRLLASPSSRSGRTF